VFRLKLWELVIGGFLLLVAVFWSKWLFFALVFMVPVAAYQRK
jgi:hypothetical protein